MTAEAAHEAELVFEYRSVALARIVEQSVGREVGEIAGDRTRATVDRDGRRVVVLITADDLVGLRAGSNTWLSLVTVAEKTVRAAT